MLDTVILTIPRERYQIFKPDMFKPNARIIENNGHCLLPCKNNPTKSDYQRGVYKPRLTITKRRDNDIETIPLKIEFSAPKLLWGNNVNELTPDDHERVRDNLQARLNEMGVNVSSDTLDCARVAIFHPAKNILIENGYTVDFILKELSKANVSQKLDMDRSGFRNGGHSLQFYSNSHSFVLYDKVKDVFKKPKRAVDKDSTLSQIQTAMKLRKIQILRLEVRLTKSAKMKSVLAKLHHKTELAFQDIFDNQLCGSIVQTYWSSICDKNGYLFNLENNPQQILEKLLLRGHMSTKQAIYMTSLYALAKDDGGITTLRGIIRKETSDRSWYRYAADLKKIREMNLFPRADWVDQITNKLRNFAPLRVNAQGEIDELACKELSSIIKT